MSYPGIINLNCGCWIKPTAYNMCPLDEWNGGPILLLEIVSKLIRNPGKKVWLLTPSVSSTSDRWGVFLEVRFEAGYIV